MKRSTPTFLPKTITRIILICLILVPCIYLCSCNSPSVDTSDFKENTRESISEQSAGEVSEEVEAAQVGSETDDPISLQSHKHDDAIRREGQNESASKAEPVIITSAADAPNKEAAVNPVPDKEATDSGATPKPTPIVTPSPTTIPTPCPTAKPTLSPEPEVKEKEHTAAPKPSAAPTAKPTVKLSPTPTAVTTAKPTPAVQPTPTPTPKTNRVWIVDVPGHYETVEESKDVWIDEQGHWEENGYWTSDWVYQCNQCGAQYSTVSAVNKHLDDSFDWDTMTGHTSYTQVSGSTYWVETDPVWVVDIPGHYETVMENKQVWIEEQGHWG